MAAVAATQDDPISLFHSSNKDKPIDLLQFSEAAVHRPEDLQQEARVHRLWNRR